MAMLRCLLISFLLSCVVSLTAAHAAGLAPVGAPGRGPRRAPAPVVPALPGELPSAPAVAALPHQPAAPVNFTEADYFQFALNLEYLEAEFYLNSLYGYGVEGVDPNLTLGGPNSTGRQVAHLSGPIQQVAAFLAFQEIDHIKIFQEYLGDKAIPRPLIDLNASFISLLQAATGISAEFNVYANDIHWLLAAFVLPYVGLTAYVGTNPFLQTVPAKQLLAGVLGVEAGQDAILRTLLYLHQNNTVQFYNQTVGDISGDIVMERQVLSKSYQIVEENIVVPRSQGPDGQLDINILAANKHSLSYARNLVQTIRILYGTGVASQPGGFYPDGLLGTVADYYLTGQFVEGPTSAPAPA